MSSSKFAMTVDALVNDKRFVYAAKLLIKLTLLWKLGLTLAAKFLTLIKFPNFHSHFSRFVP